MAWFVRQTVLFIIALIGGLLVWKTDAVALLFGWPASANQAPFPIEVYVGGVLAGLILNEFAHWNWSRMMVQFMIMLRSLGANAVMGAIGLGCAFIVLYA